MVTQHDKVKPQSMGDVLKKDSSNYALGRKFTYRKHGKGKITQEDMRKEVSVARMIGEMSAAERIITHAMLKLGTVDAEENRTAEEWKSLWDEFQAELHVFVVECGDAASEVMKTENIIGLNDVLEAHGVYEKYRKEEI